MSDKIMDKMADLQQSDLDDAINSLIRFISYAHCNSRYAIPGECDNILEMLLDIYYNMYNDAVEL